MFQISESTVEYCLLARRGMTLSPLSGLIRLQAFAHVLVITAANLFIAVVAGCLIYLFFLVVKVKFVFGLLFVL